MKKSIRAIFVLLLCCFSHSLAAQSYFDFEDEALPSALVFSKSSRWRVTRHSLDGYYSLCDSVAPANTAVSESFSFASPSAASASADTFCALLKFTYTNGAGVAVPTTGTNRFFIFVGANFGADDSLAVTNEKLKSLVLSFNGTSGDDTLRLFYLQNKKLTPVISTKQKCNGVKLAVRLVRSKEGELALSVGADGDFGSMQTYTASATAYSLDGVHVGAHLLTSSTNNRKCLVLDNIFSVFAARSRQPVPQKGDVVINEVLFNPNADGVDFVELYNRSEKMVELQGCRIANRNLSTGALNRSYALPQYALHPDEHVVVAANPDVVREQYRCENPDAFIALATMPSYPNEAGCVVLLAADSTLLEDFYYSEKMHSGVLANKKGVSLERINPNRAADEEANWLSAAQTVGFATPTYRNSQHSAREHGGSDGFTLHPEVFSPDGDGVDDMLFIDYQMPSEGYVANLTVFTSDGKAVKTLCRNATLAVEGRLSWDGVCSNGRRADVGVYVVLAEVFSLDGKVKRYKKTCVVGARF